MVKIVLFLGAPGRTPYEGLNSANQISRKLRVFHQKLEENHSIF